MYEVFTETGESPDASRSGTSYLRYPDGYRICALSGTVLPQRFRAILDRFGDHPAAMEQAGIAYAVDQIIDLIANGIQDIHIYSMNRPRTARAIMDGLSEVIKA